MGLSKKKLKAQTKLTDAELHGSLVEAAKKANTKTAKPSKDDDLFTTNVKAGDDLHKRRSKLRADRFKQIEGSTRSKAEQMLVKRYEGKLDNSGRDKFERKKKTLVFGSKHQINEDKEFGGELGDLWGAPNQTSGYEVSKRMQMYKTFAESKTVKVKQVVAPKGGQSYNPKSNEHKKLLKDVAVKEEEIVQERLEKLRQLRPSLFENEASSDESKEDKEEADDQSASDEDSDAPINPATTPVSRENIKTTAQRNRIAMVKELKKMRSEERQKKKTERDFDRMDNIIQANAEHSKQMEKRLRKVHQATEEEIRMQEQEGIVSKPTVIGRFKYKQRKQDFLLEDDLSGNMRQMKPLTNDQLLQDRYDSVFRRNLVEPNEEVYDARRNKHKRAYKFFNPVGETAKKMNVENLALKARNDEVEKGMKKQLASDVIII